MFIISEAKTAKHQMRQAREVNLYTRRNTFITDHDYNEAKR